MPRKIAFSAKAKRQQLRLARAIKRGESPPPQENDFSTWRPKRPTGRVGKSAILGTKKDIEKAAKLQSSFIHLSPEYLSLTRDLAFTTTIDRPVRKERGVFREEWLDGGGLECPRRPKFKAGQNKKEVERNEEGWYVGWLEKSKGVVEKYLEEDGGDSIVREEEEGIESRKEIQELGKEKKEEWPRSSPWFETNLEVWRQLWRVIEQSHILLVLLDARCPPLHLPPSLRSYLHDLQPKKEIILLLTKSDLVDPLAVKEWMVWMKEYWGGDVEVVPVRSYDSQALEKGKHKADIPQDSLHDLVQAIRQSHTRLLSKQNNKPTLVSDIPWERLVPGTTSNQPTTQTQKLHEQTEEDISPLTIGLVGQPNVGKSSLLNALLGEHKVRASKTPGKTKHFQTHFWGSKLVKIVDCPGLVCPSLVPHELQALAGVLPIAQIPSLPSCIHFTASLLPLEDIFKLSLPDEESSEDPYADKRTWRTPRLTEEKVEKVVKRKKVTAGTIMEAHALARGWLTARRGWPDTNRAANHMMRALADGKIRWNFWPPDSNPSSKEGFGILSSLQPTDLSDDPEHSLQSFHEGSLGSDTSQSDSEESEGSAEHLNDLSDRHRQVKSDSSEENTGGRFAALGLHDDDDDDDTDNMNDDSDEMYHDKI
ncbi:hypothetical protein M231_00917 [Tremella mesenterica]|uniref:Guanine nucleotide-binding protein-like 1 n=1 Tax=Tremella mesenterica TaxID=5217 RepID=A0A4Q1BUM2_TREME|nr:hypothetical protein M231_00917 [Tremella mesenterica]